MTIGLPRALLYYRYGELWETFFTSLGCDIAHGGVTAAELDGDCGAAGECCLPAKIYMGSVRSLLGRCDYILSPYARRSHGGDNICLRFWGICDAARNTYGNARLLEYAVSDGAVRYGEFHKMGKRLGKSSRAIRDAFDGAAAAQERHDARERDAQEQRRHGDDIKVLVAGRPYVTRDPHIGGAVVKLLAGQGCVPFYSDRFDRQYSMESAAELSPRLYWTSSRESIGAIAAHSREMDGVLLLTSFPCAHDALANEMALRSMRDVPAAQITLDGLRGEAGLETRIESFVDILRLRRRSNG